MPPQPGGARGTGRGGGAGAAISAFLRELGEGRRTAFLRRYWYADTVEETAGHLGWSLSRTKSVLFRTRKKLKAYLEQEGML